MKNQYNWSTLTSKNEGWIDLLTWKDSLTIYERYERHVEQLHKDK